MTTEKATVDGLMELAGRFANATRALSFHRESLCLADIEDAELAEKELRAYAERLAAQPAQAWIPADRLPEEDIDVLCYWSDSFPIMVGLWNGEDWQDANGAMEVWDAPPTHYQPLPAPPEVKT